MFRSRCTYEEYLKSIQNEEASPEHLSLVFESDEGYDYNISDEDDMSQKYFDPSLLTVLEGFNNDEEVLIIVTYLQFGLYLEPMFSFFHKISASNTSKRLKL